MADAKQVADIVRKRYPDLYGQNANDLEVLRDFKRRSASLATERETDPNAQKGLALFSDLIGSKDDATGQDIVSGYKPAAPSALWTGTKAAVNSALLGVPELGFNYLSDRGSMFSADELEHNKGAKLIGDIGGSLVGFGKFSPLIRLGKAGAKAVGLARALEARPALAAAARVAEAPVAGAVQGLSMEQTRQAEAQDRSEDPRSRENAAGDLMAALGGAAFAAPFGALRELNAARAVLPKTANLLRVGAENPSFAARAGSIVLPTALGATMNAGAMASADANYTDDFEERFASNLKDPFLMGLPILLGSAGLWGARKPWGVPTSGVATAAQNQAALSAAQQAAQATPAGPTQAAAAALQNAVAGPGASSAAAATPATVSSVPQLLGDIQAITALREASAPVVRDRIGATNLFKAKKALQAPRDPRPMPEGVGLQAPLTEGGVADIQSLQPRGKARRIWAVIVGPDGKPIDTRWVAPGELAPKGGRVLAATRGGQRVPLSAPDDIMSASLIESGPMGLRGANDAPAGQIWGFDPLHIVDEGTERFLYERPGSNAVEWMNFTDADPDLQGVLAGALQDIRDSSPAAKEAIRRAQSRIAQASTTSVPVGPAAGARADLVKNARELATDVGLALRDAEGKPIVPATRRPGTLPGGGPRGGARPAGGEGTRGGQPIVTGLAEPPNSPNIPPIPGTSPLPPSGGPPNRPSSGQPPTPSAPVTPPTSGSPAAPSGAAATPEAAPAASGARVPFMITRKTGQTLLDRGFKEEDIRAMTPEVANALAGVDLQGQSVRQVASFLVEQNNTLSETRLREILMDPVRLKQAAEARLTSLGPPSRVPTGDVGAGSRRISGGSPSKRAPKVTGLDPLPSEGAPAAASQAAVEGTPAPPSAPDDMEAIVAAIQKYAGVTREEAIDLANDPEVVAKIQALN